MQNVKLKNYNDHAPLPAASSSRLRKRSKDASLTETKKSGANLQYNDQNLKGVENSPQLTANFNDNDPLINTPQFRKTDTNYNRGPSKSPILDFENGELYKFNSQNPF